MALRGISIVVIAVAVVVGGRLVVGWGSGAWVGQLDPVSVQAGSSSGSRCWRGGVGVEDPVVADADHDAGGHAGQLVGQRGRVAPGIEDETGVVAVCPRRPKRSRTWSMVTCTASSVGEIRAGVHRRGPGVAGPVQPGVPLIGSATGRVLGRGVVEPVFGAGLGIVETPGRGVYRGHQRPVAKAVAGPQVPPWVGVDAATGKSLVEAAECAKLKWDRRKIGSRLNAGTGGFGSWPWNTLLGMTPRLSTSSCTSGQVDWQNRPDTPRGREHGAIDHGTACRVPAQLPRAARAGRRYRLHRRRQCCTASQSVRQGELPLSRRPAPATQAQLPVNSQGRWQDRDLKAEQGSSQAGPGVDQ